VFDTTIDTKGATKVDISCKDDSGIREEVALQRLLGRHFDLAGRGAGIREHAKRAIEATIERFSLFKQRVSVSYAGRAHTVDMNTTEEN